MRISFEEAQNRIKTNIVALSPVSKPVLEAVGYIAAENVAASMNQPPFPRSPFDGYALRSEDSAGAGKGSPVELSVVGQSFAGSPCDVRVGPNEAVRIMTGGVIPDGADCVIMQESTDEGESRVKIYTALKARENYCEAGEDFSEGDTLIAAGTRITAAAASVAASAGITRVQVFERPRVAVISTGDELLPLGFPLAPGKIYNSNNTYMGARLAELGITAVDIGIAGDVAEVISRMIEDSATRAEIVVAMGGVSVGKKDLVPQALAELGAEIVFHGIEMKPGMPAIFAMYRGTPVFGLSGNPFAAAVDFELLVRPAIALMASDSRMAPGLRRTALAEDYTKKRPVARFARATLTKESVIIPDRQGNGQLRSMVGCNCIAALPAGDEPLPKGSPVTVYTMENRYYE